MRLPSATRDHATEGALRASVGLGLLGAGLVGVAALWAGWRLLAGALPSAAPEDPPPVAQAPPARVPVVDAGTVIDARDENALAFDAQFGGRWLGITGRVTGVGGSPLRPVVWLASPRHYSAICCVFDGDGGGAMGLRAGDVVGVAGRLAGGLELRRCRVFRVSDVFNDHVSLH